MVNFLSSVRLTSRDGRSLGRRTKAQKKHQLTLETLEERYCPSLTTVNLDFDSPSTRSLDSVLTSFHRGGIVPTADGLETIKLTGYHEPATGIIDPDLRAAGSVGAVFATANNSNTNSTATIILHGALGAQISFLYGTRNQENTATKGGFTAYTYSQSRVDQYGFPGSAPRARWPRSTGSLSGLVHPLGR